MTLSAGKSSPNTVVENHLIWKKAMHEVRQQQRFLKEQRSLAIKAFMHDGLTDKSAFALRAELVNSLRYRSNTVAAGEIDALHEEDSRSQSCPPMGTLPEHIWRLSYEILQQGLFEEKEKRLSDFNRMKNEVERIEKKISSDLQETNEELFFPVDLTFGCWDHLLEALNQYQLLAQEKQAYYDEATRQCENMSPSFF